VPAKQALKHQTTGNSQPQLTIGILPVTNLKKFDADQAKSTMTVRENDWCIGSSGSGAS